MSTTDEELEQLQAEVEAQRQAVLDTRAAREEAAQASANDLRKEELLAEKARLDAELAEEERLLSHQLGIETIGSNAAEAQEAMEQALASAPATPPPPVTAFGGDDQDEEN